MYIGKKPAVAALTASDITDGIVSNAKLAQDIISADTDELLVSDAGVLKRMDYSHIKAANTPAFYANLSANQSIDSATYTKINCDTEEFDSGVYDNSTNYRFTPAEAGKFYICGNLYINSMTDAKNFRLDIYKNGSSYAYGRNNSSKTGSSISTTISIIDIADDDDYYEIFCYHNEGSALNVRGGADNTTNFFAFKIIGA